MAGPGARRPGAPGHDSSLDTAVVAGFLISVLGGSRVQIGGPTGAFVVIVGAIVHRYGYPGLAVATFMAGVTDIQAITREFREEDDLNGADPGAIAKRSVPKEVEVYEVNGPFFFGVADRVKDVLAIIGKPPKVFILRMRNVPAMDATGMNALMDLHAKCVRQGTILILSGIHAQPLFALEKAGNADLIGRENLAADVDEALARARSILDGSANGASPGTATGPGGHR